MRILKNHTIVGKGNSYLIDNPEPSNISYLWNFGSLLGLCLIIQIITGVTLAMHYNPSVLEAFNSVEHIMRDVNNGWLLRYLHANTASAFFFLVYLHIGRGFYYGSYKAPRTLVWTIGTVILVLMMGTAFLGYVLPYGQMSLWGATVITNLMSAIPWVGQDIVQFIWGGFSVNNATLNRFFALHFVLPFVLAALALMHLIALHDSAGSNNPLGVSGNYDKLPFAPYFIFKDLITIFLFIFVLSLFVFFMPNVLGDSENYVMANPMQTPAAIVPEWYLLPFYAILRSIPNKLLGVIAMFSAILILLSLPITDIARSRGMQFKPFSKAGFYIFIVNFLILMQLGAKHVESPFIEFGQISTFLYFSYFLFLMPIFTILENTMYNRYTNENNVSQLVTGLGNVDKNLKIKPSAPLNTHKGNKNLSKKTPKFNSANLLLRFFALVFIFTILCLVYLVSIDSAIFFLKGIFIRTSIILLKFIPLTSMSVICCILIAVDFDLTFVNYMNNPSSSRDTDGDNQRKRTSSEMSDSENTDNPRKRNTSYTAGSSTTGNQTADSNSTSNMTDSQTMPPPADPSSEFVKEDYDSNGVLRVRGSRYFVHQNDFLASNVSLVRLYLVLNEYKSLNEILWQTREHLEVAEDDATIDTLMAKANWAEGRINMYHAKYRIQKMADFSGQV